MVEVEEGKALSPGIFGDISSRKSPALYSSEALPNPQRETSWRFDKKGLAAGAGKAGLERIFGPKAGLKINKSDFTSSPAISLQCPSCGGQNIVLNGSRKLSNMKQIQIFKCNARRRKFSQNYIRVSPQKNKCQICVWETKNLSVTEKTAVTSDEKDVKGLLLEYHVRMKLQGYKDSTIRLSESVLRTLISREASLTNPETVKKVIADQSDKETAYKSKIWSGSRKRNVINAYTDFLKYLNMTWDSPIYEIIRKLPFIPTEQEIDDLIAASPNILATFLQLLKETGMRRGEAIKVPWKDVDLERRVIMCNVPEKGSNSRIFSDLSGKLLNMISNLPKENELLFGTATINQLKNQLCRIRKRLAFKLGNPRLKEIHMHTCRYWKGTMLYHQVKDILVVAEFLGHKNIENTRLYIQLEKNLFKNLPSDQFIIRLAHNVEESCKLLEVGFEFITGEYADGGKIFRKRK